MKKWQIQENKWDIDQYGKYETLFSLSNGNIGVRGSFEESGINRGHDGFYLNGFHETYPLSYGETFPGYPLTSQAMVNLPNPKRLHILIDGAPLDYEKIPPSPYKRTLDFRSALLSRQLVWPSPSGTKVRIETERFVSAVHKNLFCIRFCLTALEKGCSLRLSSGYDLTSRNLSKSEDPRIGVEFTEDPVAKLDRRHQGRTISLEGNILHSELSFRSTIIHETEGWGEAYSPVCRDEDDFFGLQWDGELPVRGQAVLTKYIWFEGSLPNREMSREEAAPIVASGYDALKEEHTAWWEQAWKNMETAISGDEAMQQGIRFNMFHLFQSVGKDGRTNIAAKGMTGEGYEGHYFWDTEIYMIPFFTFTNPEIAKGLLEYRHSILDAAKARAAEMGHKQGALFPWRTISGQECSSYFPAGTAQYHISSDVAHAVKVYWEGTEDEGFLLSKGLELLVETNRLWADMAVYDPEKDHYAIQNVTGPDEYTALVDNNFYTNRMVMDQMRFFRKILDNFLSLPEDTPQKQQLSRNMKTLGVKEEELRQWQALSEKIYLPYEEKRGITPQDDRFLQKPLWDLGKTPRSDFPLLMHYHPLTLYRYQVCKQPDVVLAEFLLSGQFTTEQKKRDYDYYETITTHDSSLSPCIFGCMASEIGRIEESYNYYVKTARTDLDDFHGNVKDGIHAANMAGSWIGLTYGFARMRHEGGQLRFSPLLPAAWESYSFRIRFKSRLLSVSVSSEETAYKVEEGGSLFIGHNNKSVRVGTGGVILGRKE